MPQETDTLALPLRDLNASRKAVREQIAAVLIAIAEKHGAEVERRDEPANPGWRGQSIGLTFNLNGVGAMVGISDLHGGDHAIISWYNDYSGGVGRKCQDFTSAFNCAVGDLQPRPHHKATSCPSSWYALAHYLDGGLSTAAGGNAFRPVDVPAAT